jgi:hypothetical protein
MNINKWKRFWEGIEKKRKMYTKHKLSKMTFENWKEEKQKYYERKYGQFISPEDIEKAEKDWRERIQKVRELKPITIEFKKKPEITVTLLKKEEKVNIEIQTKENSQDKTNDKTGQENMNRKNEEAKNGSTFVKECKQINIEPQNVADWIYSAQ